MKQRFKSVFISVIFINILFLTQSCYTVAHRGPWTVKPGTISPSLNYLRFNSTSADTDDDPMELVGIEARYGIKNRMDIGYMRTIDFSSYVDEDSDGADMHIFDLKYHVYDTDIIDASLQFKWGNVLNLENEDGNHYWMNMLIFSFGSELYNNRIFCNFKIEYLDDKWHPLPDWLMENNNELTFKDHSKQLTVGFEIPNRTGLYPVVVFGRQFNNEFSLGNNILNAGVNYYFE